MWSIGATPSTVRCSYQVYVWQPTEFAALRRPKMLSPVTHVIGNTAGREAGLDARRPGYAPVVQLMREVGSFMLRTPTISPAATRGF